METDVEDVDVVDANVTSDQRLSHSEETLDEGGLSGAGAPYHADFLIAFHGEIEMLQDGRVGRVTEGNVVEHDLALK